MTAFSPRLIAKALDHSGGDVASCPRCGFAGPAVAVERHRERAGHQAEPQDETENDETEMAIQKAAPEKRYTFSPVYSPNLLDAHGEFSDADSLQEAVWGFDYRTPVRKQHGEEEIGRIVELVQWPYEHDIDLHQADGTVLKKRLPAGTVYAGIIWTPRAWGEIKRGELTGLSMGGTAVRVRGVPAP